jgi:hypothetical protein
VLVGLIVPTGQLGMVSTVNDPLALCSLWVFGIQQLEGFLSWLPSCASLVLAQILAVLEIQLYNTVEFKSFRGFRSTGEKIESKEKFGSERRRRTKPVPRALVDGQHLTRSN